MLHGRPLSEEATEDPANFIEVGALAILTVTRVATEIQRFQADLLVCNCGSELLDRPACKVGAGEIQTSDVLVLSDVLNDRLNVLDPRVVQLEARQVSRK